MVKVEWQDWSWHVHVTITPEFVRQQLAKKLMNLLEDIHKKILVDLYLLLS